MKVNVLRSCVRGRFGDTKTEVSRKPVPLHSSVVECLDAWRKESPYNGEDDFLFPSVRNEGRNSGDTRHDSEEDHSPCTRPGEDRWEDNRMAQLPSLSGDQPERLEPT